MKPRHPQQSRPKNQPQKPKPPLPTTPTDWGPVADWYDQLVGESGSTYHQNVVLPGALKLLAPQSGQQILDIACGQGVLCRLLAAKGVITTGIDAAQDLIDKARERSKGSEVRIQGSAKTTTELTTQDSSLSTQHSPPLPSSLPTAHCPPPTYFTGDARNLSFLKPDHYHAAACILAIQNIHPIAPVFESVARVLAPMGKFVIVMMHPAFRGPKETAWGWDEKEKVQYRRVNRYLIPRKAPIVTNPGQSMQYTWDFHKPIELYVKALRNAGLLIDALEEWPSHKHSDSGPRAAAENTARKEIPMFLAIRALKIPTITPTPEADQTPVA